MIETNIRNMSHQTPN